MDPVVDRVTDCFMKRRVCPILNMKVRGRVPIVDKSRVIRGVGGWFIRPKKCLTPSGDESSGNRLKI